MPNSSRQHHSFIVRIWREGEGRWRGWVQHAGSQEKEFVQTLPDLLAFIQSRTGELDEQPKRGGEKERRDAYAPKADG